MKKLISAAVAASAMMVNVPAMATVGVTYDNGACILGIADTFETEVFIITQTEELNESDEILVSHVFLKDRVEPKEDWRIFFSSWRAEYVPEGYRWQDTSVIGYRVPITDLDEIEKHHIVSVRDANGEEITGWAEAGFTLQVERFKDCIRKNFSHE